MLKGISVVTNFGDHLIRCENLAWLLSSLATLLVYIGQTLLPKQFLEAGKNLFVGAGNPPLLFAATNAICRDG